MFTLAFKQKGHINSLSVGMGKVGEKRDGFKGESRIQIPDSDSRVFFTESTYSFRICLVGVGLYIGSVEQGVADVQGSCG
jgi:hypothetical protein